MSLLTASTVIEHKRDGRELSREEIRFFIQGVTRGEIEDYQATAWLMAVFLRGLTLSETVALTEAMLESGVRHDLSAIPGRKCDKHSTGGVGDKVSLILAPLAAACGLRVPTMSGRGLGFTGGTLDKLESIPGFQVRLTREKFESVLRQIGCAMIGQSEEIVPADRKLYSLRDVTGTVECIPLIVASILSKKLAEGTESLVLDVKVGSGAFMKTASEARKLSRMLVQVGSKLGLKCRAILTNMDQPLGYAVGNSLEVIESVEVLRCKRFFSEALDTHSSDLKELSVHLCAHMLQLSGEIKSINQARKFALTRLQDGGGWEKFQQLVEAQGGSVASLQEPISLPLSPSTVVWSAKKTGYLSKIDSQTIGRILIGLGGGRVKASDVVDPGVGLVFHRKLGARVKSGEPIATVHYTRPENLAELEAAFFEAVRITDTRNAVPKLIFEAIGK